MSTGIFACLDCDEPNVDLASYCHRCGSPLARLRVDSDLLVGWSLFPEEERDFPVHFQNTGGGRLNIRLALLNQCDGQHWSELLTDQLCLPHGDDNTLLIRVRGGELEAGRTYQILLRVESDSLAGSRDVSADRLWDRWCKATHDYPIEVQVKARGMLVVNRRERHLGDVVQVSEMACPGLFQLHNAGDASMEISVECHQSFVRLPRQELSLGARDTQSLPLTLHLLGLPLHETYEVNLLLRNRVDHQELERLTVSFVLQVTSLELPLIGVDFGTSSSKVAMLGGSEIVQLPLDGHELFPSNVYVRPGGGLVIGEEASAYKGLAGYCLNLKSFLAQPESSVQIGGREFVVHALVKDFLRRLFRKATSSPVFQQWAGDSVNPAGVRLIVTIPATARVLGEGDDDFKARRQTREREMRAILSEIGFADINILVESTAVSFFYAALDTEMVEGRQILVFDCGAGTSDVSVLRVRLERNEDHGYYYRVFDVLAEEGVEIGGNLFDAALYDLVVERMDEEQRQKLAQAVREQSGDGPSQDERSHRLLDEVRLVKERMGLSWNKTEVQDFHLICPGIIEADKAMPLERTDLSNRIRPLVDRLEELCHDAIQRAGLHDEDVDRVYVVGGGSFLPPVQNRLNSLFGRKRVVSEKDRQTCVARGAVASGGTKLRQVLASDYGYQASAGPRVLLIRRGAIYPVTRTTVLHVSQAPPFYIELAILQCDEGREVSIGMLRIEVNAGTRGRLVLHHTVDELGDFSAWAVYDPEGANLVFKMGPA